MSKHFFTSNPILGITIEKIAARTDSYHMLVRSIHRLRYQARLYLNSLYYFC